MITPTHELIYYIFKDFSEEERRMINVSQDHTYPYETKAWAWLPELYYQASAKLCYGDKFDEITGIALALTKLREYIISRRYKMAQDQLKNRPWIPKAGELYYTIEPCGGHYKIIKQQWCQDYGSQTNVIDLKNGIVFKTEQEAQKYIRKREQEGRTQLNKWRKAECKLR